MTHFNYSYSYSYSYNDSAENTNNDDQYWSTSCYVAWSNDQWCDKSCNVKSCNFDSYYCNRCMGLCEKTFEYLILQLANRKYPYELITVNEACEIWQILLGLNPEWKDLGGNCSTVFDVLDLNDNGYIGMHEAIIASAERWGLNSDMHSQLKMQQIDCSMCLQNASLYYY